VTPTTQVAPANLPPLPDLSLAPVRSTTPTTTTVSGAPPAPQGNAIAILDQRRARRRRAALIVAGLGVTALGLGGAGWKFTHRASKYWPA